MPSRVEYDIIRGILTENSFSSRKFIKINKLEAKLMHEVVANLRDEKSWINFQKTLAGDAEVENQNIHEIVLKVNELIHNNQLKKYYLAWGELNLHFRDLFGKWNELNEAIIRKETQIDRLKAARSEAFFQRKETISIEQIVNLELEKKGLIDELDNFLEESDEQFVTLIDQIQSFEYLQARETLESNYKDEFERWQEIQNTLLQMNHSPESPEELDRIHLLQEKNQLEANPSFAELIHIIQCHRNKVHHEEENVVVDTSVEFLELGATTDELINTLDEHFKFLHHIEMPEEGEEEHHKLLNAAEGEGKEHLTHLGLFFHSIPLVMDFTRGLTYLYDAITAYQDPHASQRQTKIGAGVVGGLASLAAGIIGSLLLAGVGVAGFLAVAPVIIPALVVGVYAVTLYRDSYIVHQAQRRLEMAYQHREQLESAIAKSASNYSNRLHDPRIARLTIDLLKLNKAIHRLEKAEEKAKWNRLLSAVCMVGFGLFFGAVFATGLGALLLGIIAAAAIIATTVARLWDHYQEAKEAKLKEKETSHEVHKNIEEGEYESFKRKPALEHDLAHIEKALYHDDSKHQLENLLSDTNPASKKEIEKPPLKPSGIKDGDEETEEDKEREGRTPG